MPKLPTVHTHCVIMGRLLGALTSKMGTDTINTEDLSAIRAIYLALLLCEVSHIKLSTDIKQIRFK